MPAVSGAVLDCPCVVQLGRRVSVVLSGIEISRAVGVLQLQSHRELVEMN